MKARSVRSLVVLGVLAAAACSDDATDVSTLSEAEAQQLASAVLTTALSVFAQAQVGGTPQPAGPALAPYAYEYAWDGTVACPGGGTVTAEASVATSGDTETGASSVDMAFTQVHSGCVVQSGSQSFTFDGSPSVVVEISWEFDGESVASYGGSIEGGLDYEFDGRSGHCAISYEYSGTTNTSTGSASASLTGSVCGVSMSYEYEVG